MKIKTLVTNVLLLLSMVFGSLAAAKWIHVKTQQEVALANFERNAQAAEEISPKDIAYETKKLELYKKNIDTWNTSLEFADKERLAQIENETEKQVKSISKIVSRLHHNLSGKNSIATQKASLLKEKAQTKTAKRRRMIDRELEQLDVNLTFTEHKISHEELAKNLLNETSKIAAKAASLPAKRIASTVEIQLDILEQKSKRSQ
jgi:hypothetical protein